MEKIKDNITEQETVISSVSAENLASAEEVVNPQSKCEDSVSEPLSQDESQALNRRPFGWLDVIVILLTFAISQALGGFIAMSLGVEMPSEFMRSSFDTETVEAAASRSV